MQGLALLSNAMQPLVGPILPRFQRVMRAAHSLKRLRAGGIAKGITRKPGVLRH